MTVKDELAQGYASGGKAGDKIKRDAFLYIGSKAGGKTGQCKSCVLWMKRENACVIHSTSEKIGPEASCGFYVPGSPAPSIIEIEDFFKTVTPKESGLVRREVRCENCRYAKNGATVCGLYVTLNNEVPESFELDERIEPQGCCNAQMP